ncbi:MAG: valine--tRNA ligase, partial [Roseiarcus sp.]
DHDAARTVAMLDGLDRFEARKRVAAMMEMEGLLARIEPNTHTVPHGDRSNAVIEPWLTDQWYVDARTLAQPALAAVRAGATAFTPKNWEKTYFDWLENIQPWCVSRQLWWGHQIPAWYGPKLSGHNFVFDESEIFVGEDAESVVAAANAYYGREVRIVADRRAAMAEWSRAAAHPATAMAAAPIWRDPDVLDTWFSSALWPFSTLGWPEETPELERYYPTSVLVTGFDIIYFWVARMMMMGLYFMHDIPFRDVYIHALVRDEKGAKMSKSKGNVIDPLALIDRYGADSLRFTLAAMAAQGRDIKLSTARVEGYRNFATKLWNAARFAELNGCRRVAGFDPAAAGGKLNRWILDETAKAVDEAARAIEAFRFNDAANAVYRFVWNIFCDWHLELAKPVLQAGEGGPARAEAQATIAYVLDEILALLHPFMPFLTEELWAIAGEEGPKRAGLLALGPWPRGDFAVDPDAEAEIGWLIDLVSEIRSVRSEMGVPPAAQLPLTLVEASAPIVAYVENWGETIRRLARVTEIGFAQAAPAGSAQMLVRDTVAVLPLAGVVDIDAERARLAREIAAQRKEVAGVDAKLANADFVARAPEEVVEENRERREAALARIVKIEAALARFDLI